MSYLYVIQGSTGEYSDCTTWLFQGFTSEQKAQCICDGLNEKLKSLVLHSSFEEVGYFNNNPRHKEFEAGLYEMLKLDRRFRCDYTGSDYRVVRVELGD
jgi:hypothetical protein